MSRASSILDDRTDVPEVAGTVTVPSGEHRDNRYIYNGDTKPTAPGFALRGSRRATRRKVSTFNIIVVLFSAGISIVLYINNIITVNRLAYDINQLQVRYTTITNTNAALRAEVTRKAARERIGPIATEQLGLLYPAEQPVWIDVDEELLERVQKK